MHTAHFCVQITPANILILFTGTYHRLHSYNTFTFYFTIAAIGVKNMPVTAVQFHRERIMVFNSNAISKHKLRLQRVAVILLIECFNANLNTFRNHADHTKRFRLNVKQSCCHNYTNDFFVERSLYSHLFLRNFNLK